MQEDSSAVDLPINADFEGGFAVEPEGVATTSRGDRDGVPDSRSRTPPAIRRSPFEYELAVERIRAACRAIDQSGREFC